MRRAWRILRGPLLSLVALLLLGLVLELGFRTYRSVWHDENFFGKLGYQLQDPRLGWLGTMLFGDPEAKRFKVFFVGDSFTFSGMRRQGAWRRARHMYYGVVGANLDVELFVYGGSGYGTLQEYLVIDTFIDVIEPDLVVLQTTNNDFVNNYWPLEKESWIHNNYLVRPYLESGETVYRYPRGPAFVREVLVRHSHLVYFIVSRLDKIGAQMAEEGKLTTVEDEIVRSGLEYEPFAAAVEVTDTLVGMIKERCGETPLVAFPVLPDAPYRDQFRRIFEGHQIPFLDAIPELAWEAEARSRQPSTQGPHGSGHWGKAGHAACGNYLTEFLKERFEVPARGESDVKESEQPAE